MDEYYNIGFEDIIGHGDVKTRFKYKKVAKHGFGLENSDIIFLDDQKLNNLVSLKKYRTYRDDEDMSNMHRVRTIKNQYRDHITESKAELKREMKLLLEIQKAKLLEGGKNLKYLEKKAERERKNKKFIKKRKRSDENPTTDKDGNSKTEAEPGRISMRRKNLY